MNRNILIFVLLQSMGAGLAATAQETHATNSQGTNARFQVIVYPVTTTNATNGQITNGGTIQVTNATNVQVTNTAIAQETNAPVVQETIPGAALSWSDFSAIAQKNIFDPTRSGYSRLNHIRQRSVSIRIFTYRGTMDDAALFTGEGTPSKGYVKEGDLINGFKVLKVALDYVKLAEPNGDIVTLAMDDNMRREDEGPWHKSDQPAPLVIASSPASPETPPDVSAASSSASSPAPAGESDILKKLRLKREQEDK